MIKNTFYDHDKRNNKSCAFKDNNLMSGLASPNKCINLAKGKC